MTESTSRSLWDKVEPLLLSCERPARYIGGEFEAVPGCSAPYRFTLVYPDVYEVGLSNQGLAILYRTINSIEGACAERAYVPWGDMAALMRENDIPLYSLESFEPLLESDVVGFTLQHELCYTNVVEALDLSGIPVLASERGEGCPLVVAGGPVAYNCEPVAGLFDAVMIGEGEELCGEFVREHMRMVSEGLSRAEIVRGLARIPGVYVPSLYGPDPAEPARMVPLESWVPPVVTKRVLADFDSSSPHAQPVVPYADLVHDRLAEEILRGCSRGCRFCQAGMTYRPVRERSADSVVSGVLRGLAGTGYDEVSLTSLSSTDHSQIEEILRRLDAAVDGLGISLSLPSQRLDGFGVDMALLALGGGKKSGLTFAPEAGTQRLRDIINKNVTEDDLFSAVRAAFGAGWRRMKLYFMIGLPFETDDDVAGIADLANRTYEMAKDQVPDSQGGNVRLTVSCSLFEPKAQTPFQWFGMCTMEEARRKVGIIREAGLHRGIDFSWHDPEASMVEGAFSRGGRDLLDVVIAAWKRGCTFDAWSEKFELSRWLEAAESVGVDLQEVANRPYEVGEALPWSHISAGVDERYLIRELDRACDGATTSDCTFGPCTGCGVCRNLDVSNVIGGGRGRR